MFGHKHSRITKFIRVMEREDQREYRSQGLHDRRVADEAFAQDAIQAALDVDAPAIYEREPVECDQYNDLIDWECGDDFYLAQERVDQAHEDAEYEAMWAPASPVPTLAEVGGIAALDFGFHADDTTRVSERFSDAHGYIRVSDLAKRLDLPNMAVVQYLQGSGEWVKSPSSRVALVVAERLEAHPYLAAGLRSIHGCRHEAKSESQQALDALRVVLSQNCPLLTREAINASRVRRGDFVLRG